MAYFLRQEKKKHGVYLQMYETYWDKHKRQPRSRSIQAFGYVKDLVCADMPDPIGFYKKYVEQENARRAEILADETRPRAFAEVQELNIGYMLFESLLNKLDVK